MGNIGTCLISFVWYWLGIRALIRGYLVWFQKWKGAVCWCIFFLQYCLWAYTSMNYYYRGIYTDFKAIFDHNREHIIQPYIWLRGNRIYFLNKPTRLVLHLYIYIYIWIHLTLLQFFFFYLWRIPHLYRILP